MKRTVLLVVVGAVMALAATSAYAATGDYITDPELYWRNSVTIPAAITSARDVQNADIAPDDNSVVVDKTALDNIIADLRKLEIALNDLIAALRGS